MVSNSLGSGKWIMLDDEGPHHGSLSSAPLLVPGHRQRARSPEFKALKFDLPVETKPGEPVEKAFHSGSDLLAAHPLTETSMWTDAECKVSSFTPVDDKLVRNRPPAWIPVGGGEDCGHHRTLGEGYSIQVDVLCRLTGGRPHG